ncbi:regulator of nonsense transcripts 3A isoform X2 [Lissotriton helveticus]
MIRVRERRVVGIQLRDTNMRPRLDLQPVCGRPRQDRRASLSKVVIRRLPPSITKEQLEEQLHPLPAHDYFEFCAADPSLYPHLFSRAYIHFRNPEDIILFRDRFDGYIFIDTKGVEYPAVVEYAPFQKISKKKLKKKDAKAGSIEEDPEYKTFLENYCADNEKVNANPETMLGEIEAKTKDFIARRSTPLLEFIKNRKLEKQKIREEKREERRKRELEKKRIREEEKRKRKDDERRKRKESEKQRKVSEKDTQIQLLKKSDRGDESSTEKADEKEESEMDDFKWEKSPASAILKSRQSGSCVKDAQEKFQSESDKEQRDTEKRFHEKEPERPRYWLDDGRKHRNNYEFDKFVRRNEEDFKWGKGYNHDRGKKGSHSYSFSMESLDKLVLQPDVKESRERNVVRWAASAHKNTSCSATVP